MGKGNKICQNWTASRCPPVKLDLPPKALSMDSEVILFTSPKAGSGAGRQEIPRLLECLTQAGIAHQCVSDPQVLRDRIQRCAQRDVSRPTVIAAGGDGTLSLVAENSDDQTSLLPMPMGTENLLARYLGQSNRAEDVMQTLQHGQTRRFDAGRANGKLFLIMATVGFDAEVVRRLHLRRKGHIQKLSYLKPILQTVGRYRFPKLQVARFDHNDVEIDAQQVGWAMVFNLPCYGGGLRIAPHAVGDDGQLDLMTFAHAGIASSLGYVAAIAAGVHRRWTTVEQHLVDKVTITAPGRVAYELDGDYAGRLPLTIETVPQRILLLSKTTGDSAD